MAFDRSALLDPLAQLKLTDITERIRSATEKLYQELNDAEVTSGDFFSGVVGASTAG